MCSGQHTVSLLLSRLNGWDPTDYWKPSHPSQVAYREAVARAFGTTPAAKLRTAIDGCGIETFAFPLREVARAYAMLADPSAIPAGDPRAELAGSLTIDPRRDAGQPGADRRPARPARHLADEGGPGPARQQGRDGGAARVAILPGARTGTSTAAATGMAVKIEDGDGYDRGTWAASVEALRQAGVARRRRPARARRATTGRRSYDPHGRLGAETIADFELAPVGELIG